jgi:MYXO-CTERM domain-containing protein
VTNGTDPLDPSDDSLSGATSGYYRGGLSCDSSALPGSGAGLVLLVGLVIRRRRSR